MFVEKKLSFVLFYFIYNIEIFFKDILKNEDLYLDDMFIVLFVVDLVKVRIVFFQFYNNNMNFDNC